MTTKNRLAAALACLLLTAAPGLALHEGLPPGVITWLTGVVELDDAVVPLEAAGVYAAKDGQKLHTTQSYAEVLVGEHGYLRIGENSLVEILSVSPEAVNLKIHSGSALLDLDDKLTGTLSVSCGDAEIRIAAKGDYRIDGCGGDSELRVLRGQATVSAAGAKISLKSKQQVALTAGATAAKLAKAPADAFDIWNKERVKRIKEEDRRQRYKTDGEIMGELPGLR